MTNELKKEVIELIKKLPDDITLEDIQYHLYVKQKLEIADNQTKNGETSSHNDVMERVRKKWFK